MEAPQAQRVNRIGLVVIVVTFVALAQLLFFTYQQRSQTDCQAQVNTVFLSTLKQRAAINDGDRNSIKMLVNDIAQDIAKGRNQKQFEKSIDQYNARDKKLQALRDNFKYPEVERACT